MTISDGLLKSAFFTTIHTFKCRCKAWSLISFSTLPMPTTASWSIWIAFLIPCSEVGQIDTSYRKHCAILPRRWSFWRLQDEVKLEFQSQKFQFETLDHNIWFCISIPYEIVTRPTITRVEIRTRPRRKFPAFSLLSMSGCIATMPTDKRLINFDTRLWNSDKNRNPRSCYQLYAFPHSDSYNGRHLDTDPLPRGVRTTPDILWRQRRIGLWQLQEPSLEYVRKIANPGSWNGHELCWWLTFLDLTTKGMSRSPTNTPVYQILIIDIRG